MSEWKCGVEPCPMCKKTPLAIDLDLGVTIGCATNSCNYYFVAKGRTLKQALIIWNEEARKENNI
jgi:hypothetical protein